VDGAGAASDLTGPVEYLRRSMPLRSICAACLSSSRACAQSGLPTEG
jgi:hypothetical protein